jgi:fatty acid desaturase
MLRYTADRRTVLYLVATGALLALNWHLGRVHPVFYPLQLFMFFTSAVISHNHNHLAIWKSRPANLVTSYIIALFYGYPAVAWIPTHNQVHHKLNNKEGDSSRSPKFFKGNHLFSLLVYPTLTSVVQSHDIRAFLVDLWRRNRKAFWSAASEYAVFIGAMVALFVIDWRRALLFVLIPQQVALFAIQVVNFLQHVESDAYSEWNHSRNFVSPVLNALLFNNGLHTVHHMKPGVHWSRLPELHAQHEAQIDPALLVPSLWGYIGYTYFVRPFTRPSERPAAPELPPVG